MRGSPETGRLTLVGLAPPTRSGHCPEVRPSQVAHASRRDHHPLVSVGSCGGIPDVVNPMPRSTGDAELVVVIWTRYWMNRESRTRFVRTAPLAGTSIH